MHFFYSLGIRFYIIAIYLASPFNVKAKLWLSGRKNWRENYQNKNLQNCVWFHCASLGEFEMARPLIEKLKTEKPTTKILLTFFSPSGYEIRKNYELVDLVMYLPADTKKNAADFIKLFKPSFAVFVKYEIWLNYIVEIKKNKIKSILISAGFQNDQRFFKSYGRIFREGLASFDSIYVQNNSSHDLLKKWNIDSTIAGDTRYDRVFQNAKNKKSFEEIKNWCGDAKIIIAGSSWQPEESFLANFANENKENLKIIFATHDISDKHLLELKSKLKIPFSLYSQLKSSDDSSILIIDNIGMLSSLYQYAHIAIIGGGFSGKLHNILEAATFGIPILFGPKHDRFQEANEFLNAKAAFEFSNQNDLNSILNSLLNDDEKRNAFGKNALAIVEKNLGASEIIWKDYFTSF